MNRHDPGRRDDDRAPQDRHPDHPDDRQFSPRGLGDDPARGRERFERAPGDVVDDISVQRAGAAAGRS